MAAIVSDFPQLAQDADPNRVAIYTGVYADLTALGLAVPATPANVITRAALLLHLQTLAGQIVNDELTTDPDERDYAGAANDAARASLINAPFLPAFLRRFPGTGVYRTTAGSTDTSLTLVETPGATDPGFTTIPGLAANINNLVLRFGPLTTTVALRGVFRRVTAIAADNILTLQPANPLPVAPGLLDICRVGLARNLGTLRARLSAITVRLPFCPNDMTAADITAAQSP